MIGEKKVLAIISARGGSKGVPKKNIKNLAGKPLIAWSIEEAKKSLYIDKLILTSDDKEIIEVAKKWGCEVPFIRPEELAKDETPGIDPVIHAIEQLPGYDFVILLQPTSPLRIVRDIDGCIELCFHKNAHSVVTVTETDQSPYWMFHVDKENYIEQFIKGDVPKRRQELQNLYTLNGAVYVAKIDSLLSFKSFLTKDTLGYIMPKERSIDIDTIFDFKLCNYLLKYEREV